MFQLELYTCDPTRDRQEDVMVLAPLGTRDWLHVGRPPPARAILDAPDHRVPDFDDFMTQYSIQPSSDAEMDEMGTATDAVAFPLKAR